MTEKQKIFADEYLIDLNATRAYKVAYPRVKNDEVAAAAATRLLRNVKVAAYISERMKERQKRTEVTQDRVIEELAAIAFAKATDFVQISHGNVILTDTSKLSENQIKAIAGIKEGKNGIELKLNDKEKALELLGRHLGMFKDKLEVTGWKQSRLSWMTIRQMRGGGLVSAERLLLSGKYKAFLRCDAPVEFLEGTTAAGKTTVGLFKFMLKVAESPKKLHIIAAKDTGTAEKNIINKDLGIMDDFGVLVEYNGNGTKDDKIPHILFHTSGGDKVIYVMGYGDKKKWQKALGGQYGLPVY